MIRHGAAVRVAMRVSVVVAGLIAAAEGPAIRPQDDLFGYANEAWLQGTAVPGERVAYGTFAELADRTEADLQAIVDEVLARPSRPAGSTWQQIADLYISATDEPTIERRGAAPLQPELARIDAVRTSTALATEIGYLSSIGAGGPFAGSAGADPLHSGETRVRVLPGGTLLPGRAYYFDPDPPF